MFQRIPMPFDAYGRMHLAFGEIEFLLHVVAWFLIGELEPHRVGPAVTKRLGFYELTVLISDLAKTGNRPEEVKSVVGEIVSEARALNSRRNRWTHAMLLGLGEDSLADHIRTLITGGDSMFRFDANELLAFRDQCDRLRHDKIYPLNRALEGELFRLREANEQ